jgi:dTMP kinase
MSFVVIEGLDGSGKSTQLKMLRSYLESIDLPYQYVHFPRISAPVYGDLVARFLRGELGEIDKVNPYLVALIYAGDRLDAKKMILQWLEQDILVIVDRYVYSNIAYQCAKFPAGKEREELKDWILNLEYGYNDLPKPDLSVYLDVPFMFTRENLTSNRTGEDREYLKGKKDIHEEDLDFQARVREVYLEQSGNDNFIRIECSTEEKGMKSPEEIFSMIREAISPHVKDGFQRE